MVLFCTQFSPHPFFFNLKSSCLRGLNITSMQLRFLFPNRHPPQWKGWVCLASVYFTDKGQDRDGGCVLGVSMRCCCRLMLRTEVHELVLPSLVQGKGIYNKCYIQQSWSSPLSPLVFALTHFLLPQELVWAVSSLRRSLKPHLSSYSQVSVLEAIGAPLLQEFSHLYPLSG